MQTKHYFGLTDQEVLESRRIHGANLLTPPEKPPFGSSISTNLAIRSS